MNVAIRCVICSDEAIGWEIAPLPFPRLNLDGSFEAEQCLFVAFNVWTKASCIRNGGCIICSVSVVNLIFPCPFTLTIAALCSQHTGMLFAAPTLRAMYASGGQWSAGTEAHISSPASNSSGNCITAKLAKVRFNSDKRRAGTTVVFSRAV